MAMQLVPLLQWLIYLPTMDSFYGIYSKQLVNDELAGSHIHIDLECPE